ncbi:glycosyltransferase family 2 protein [Cyanobium sp. ATX 6F1]|uniref:glycosyltransferase family 2 protein n=1 Tax=Cyanobium sp. ATX 6F1 TaxID=2823702 RepID=UPI0020CB92B6|nr:glycosyltransferase family 2 protein [Cyanobium sp. ATX 6F1]MCP9917453.1 glycosyltransferase family 2 protein [Cyanobium sp. ATX 6F1]
MPRLSIVTPFRNAEVFLPDLVRTLQQQTFRDWECLLVDDDSEDRSAEVLTRCIAGDRRFRQLPMPADASRRVGQRLPARPRNHGLAHVGSPLVAFLDCDDLWHPRKLEHQLAFHQAGGLDLSVTAYGRFRTLGQPLLAVRCPPERLVLEQMRQSNPIPMLTVLVRAELLEGGFPLVPHEDYLLWLNLRRDHPDLRYGVLPSLLAFYRLHDANHSRHLFQVTAWTYGVFRHHGLDHAAALRQLMLWGSRHALQVVSERRLVPPPVSITSPLNALLGGAPLVASLFAQV